MNKTQAVVIVTDEDGYLETINNYDSLYDALSQIQRELLSYPKERISLFLPSEYIVKVTV